jgi:predicted dinucleotide-binding enzyme
MMDVTIIGTGNMARGIGTRLLAGGHSVTLLSRNPAGAAALVSDLQKVAAKGAGVRVEALGSPIDSPVVVLAVAYRVAGDLVRGESERLAGKILVDVTNPLNASYDGLVTGGSSAAEELAKLLPASTRVVKAFNTTFAGTLVAGQVAGQPLDVFVAGDDAEAKQVVAGLIADGGLRPLDVGPLVRARQLEQLGFLGIAIQQPLGTGFMSAWKLLS